MRVPWRDAAARGRRQETELDETLAWFFRDQAGRGPSDEVWKRIQAGLEGGPLAFPEQRPRWRVRVPEPTRVLGLVAVSLIVLSLVVNVALPIPRRQPDVIEISQAPRVEAPIVHVGDDLLSSRLLFQSRREERLVMYGLLPSADPLLQSRRGDWPSDPVEGAPLE